MCRYLYLTTLRLRRVTATGTARWPTLCRSSAGASAPVACFYWTRGTSGAHQREICPEVLRTAEISAAGQAACLVHPLRSEGSPHKTRPTDRLIQLAIALRSHPAK